MHLILALLLSSPDALAVHGPGPFREKGRFGLGLGAGTSTAGLSAKYFFSERLALQGVLGAGYGSGYSSGPGGGWDEGAALGADLLFEMPALYEDEGIELAWALGPGAGIWIGDNWAALAASGALGFECNITAVPLDLVVEYRPRLLLAPEVAFDWISFTGHIRYYF